MQTQYDAAVLTQGDTMMESVGIRSNVDSPGGVNYDRVFVPQYESYSHRFPGGPKPPTPSPTVCNRSDLCSASWVRGGARSRLPPSSPRSGLQGVLQGHTLTLPPWPVISGNGSPSSVNVIDSGSDSQHGPQYQQSWSGLHRKLSDFQVALRASEKAREDGEKETQALRVYVSSVETAAAGLVSRVEDLENLLALSSAFRQGHDAEQLRGKIATEALKEAQKQATVAAQSIAVARDSTMELDKVKRETNAWAVAQQAEIEYLNMEAAECRMHYEASSKLIQDLRAQIANLQGQLEQHNAKIEDSQRTLQIEARAFLTKYEEAKFAVIEKANQCDELMQALELSTVVGKAAELKLEELLADKKEMIQKNEMLEQQLQELKSQDHGAAVVQYDHDLRRVRNALGDEKAQLLDDLAQLRLSNQNLTEEMKVDWHEKLRSSTALNSSSSDQHQQHHTLSQQTADARLSANASKSSAFCTKEDSTTRGCNSSNGCRYSQEEVEERSLSVASSVSASGSWHTDTSATKDCNHGAAVLNTWSHSSSDCSSKETLQQSHCAATVRHCGKFSDSRSQFLSPGAAIEGFGDENNDASVLAFKELTLLAAAQHEIMKLKEESQGRGAAAYPAALLGIAGELHFEFNQMKLPYITTAGDSIPASR